MQETFKVFGFKPWGVTDDAFVYNGNRIPFSEMDYFKIVSVPSSSILGNNNGVVQGHYGGKEILCPFKFADRDAAFEAINYIQEKIDASHGLTRKYKYKLISQTGTTMEVYDSYVIVNQIKNNSIVTRMVKGTVSTEIRVRISDIVSVVFKEQLTTKDNVSILLTYIDHTKGKNSTKNKCEISVPLSQLATAKVVVQHIEDRR